ncbi:MAG: DUF6493 family protein, partial [Planctomycetota bacterium]
MIEALQDAILKKDPDAVVAALANWDENQRQAAIEPFNILMLALGFEDNVVQPCKLRLNDPVVEAKRKQDGLILMTRKEKNIDYEMSYIAWLGRYGLQSLEACIRFSAVPDHEARAAQVMADRQPPWWDQWYAGVTGKDIDITAEYWSLLYQRKLVTAEEFAPLRSSFATQLPDTLENAPEATRQVLREIPACCELVYSIPNQEFQLLETSRWVPVIECVRDEKLLDSKRLLQSLITALHELLNQTERNGCLMLIKAAKADAKTLAAFQKEWAGFVSDSQAVVAGFAVDQLRLIEKAGLLDAREAVTVLPGIFSHKPKKYAKTALDLLSRIAVDDELRREAVEAATVALMHANKDIQKAALDLLEQHLKADDEAAQQTIALHLETISPTLKEKATSLLQSNPPEEVESFEESASVDQSELETNAASLPEAVRTLLRVDEAVAAAKAGSADLTCRWSQQDVPVLTTAARLTPIETVEELIEVTSAAVERLEDPETAERIISGIMRLYKERPNGFKTMTESLAKRACAGAFERPQRGLVGGYFGSGFSLLIAEWLEVMPEDKLDEDVIALLQTPLHRYLRELEQRVRTKTAYPLISAATHAGGWLDPRVWIERLKQAQEEQLDVMEMDLERSCLRLAPDHRTAALESARELKPPYQTLAMVALGDEGNIVIDPALTPPVWIAALRARDAWGDVSEILVPEERSQITDEIARLPDVIYPSDYKWTAGERLANTTMQQDVIRAWTSQEAEQRETKALQRPMDELLAALERSENTAEALQSLPPEPQTVLKYHFLTADLHKLKNYFSPGFLFPYLAGQWPMKLDWYWCLATKALAHRVESGASVEELYSQFLLPLFETDRPLTLMAARALWIATVSKDGNSHSMAIEVWITLADTDRLDLDLLSQSLTDVMAGGWVKLNRAGEVLAEVAAVSPVQAWCIATVLEAVLISLDPFPRNVAVLLEPLDEMNE